MRRKTKPSIVFGTEGERNRGDVKYYRTRSGATYHADRYCKHLEGKVVIREESGQIDAKAKKCNHCTTDNPEFQNLLEVFKSQ